jgi:glycosyltransferase involved in cell wall biosynthesis
LILYETLYPDHAGGIESRNHELALALAGRGHRVTLAGFGRGATAAEEPVEDPGGRVERRLLGGPRALYDGAGRRSHRRALGFALRALTIAPARYDVVETPSMPFFHLPGIAASCRLARVPLLVVWYEVWGAYWKSYVGPARAPVYRLLERAAARLGRRVAATSLLGRDRLARLRPPRPDDDIAIAPCGVDPERVRQAAGEASPAGPPIVVAGRLLAHKRVDLLIDALPHLAGVAGGASDSPGVPVTPLVAIFGDGPERHRLEARAVGLGVRERIVFHGTVDSLAAVWRGFGAARIAVHPSEREGFGLVPLEAMAAGLPVVHCRSQESAVSELVRDGVEGLMTAPSAAALAAGIRELLTDEPRRQRLAEAARRRAAEYSWSRLAAEYERLLYSLAGG